MTATHLGLTQAVIEDAFARLGLAGARAVLHTSLRSFGRVEQGAGTVVNAIVRTFDVALLPAFSFASTVPAPPDDRPAQNGLDYTSQATRSLPAVPFRVETADIDRNIGAVPRVFADRPDALRSDHPWHSWVGRGAGVETLLHPHPWQTTNLPLERLAEVGAQVVLAGVTLMSCTAVHVAEERAGKRPFIRWAMDRHGVVRRVRAAGCSKGFGALEPFCADLFRESMVGESRVRVAPLAALIDRCADAIRQHPEITICSNTCVRCRDSVRGGPLETTSAS